MFLYVYSFHGIKVALHVPPITNQNDTLVNCDQNLLFLVQPTTDHNVVGVFFLYTFQWAECSSFCVAYHLL